MSTPPTSTATDFDFLLGSWSVHHRKLRERLTDNDDWYEFEGLLTSRATPERFAIFDDNRLDDPDGAYEAIAMRTFDPDERLWSIWWFDQRHPRDLAPPVVGSFVDGVGTFITDGELNGKPIVLRFLWLDTHTAVPRWEQALSSDGGATWETNWQMWFSRVP